MKQGAELGVLGLRAPDGKGGATKFSHPFLVGNIMLLPRKGALAIAAVIDIALNARGRPVAAKALATRHRLPPRHLEPVLQALVRHGILKGTRGPRGGYELAREQRRITADDILRASGAAEEINGAPLANSALLSKVVMPALGEAEHAFSAALARINVEDLARSAAALRKSADEG
jgi:Rrf2 family transcriptional regulator, iron-sulfur cluster assembly transcription factor